MHAPLRRVRHSIDTLQKNIYDYHHRSSLSLAAPETKSTRRCQRLLQFIEQSCAIIQALFVRFIFILSTIVAVWRLVEETRQIYYWYLLLLLLFLLVETYVTVYSRKGHEYKWFCPSAFAYLLAIVPCIWLLELNQHYQSLASYNRTEISLAISDPSTARTSVVVWKADAGELSEASHSDETDQVSVHKRALSTILTTINTQPRSLDDVLKGTQELLFKLKERLSIREWHMIIEQTTLLILILSRWLLPKGDMTREELSQLLVVYIGIAADIIEFFELFKEDEVRRNLKLSLLVLLLWTLSLLQFCLAFTISRGRKSRLYHILSYSTVFFTSKNGLIIVLQWYRISVIVATTISQERRHHRKLVQVIQVQSDEGQRRSSSKRTPKEEEEEAEDGTSGLSV